MNLRIDKIEHDQDRTPPLRVAFRESDDADTTHTIDVDASALQSFGAFQRVVANRLGIFLRSDVEYERTAQQTRTLWGDMIEDGFRAGRAVR
ncbi:MAG TPA: hypothetical protein DD670_07445 [Planctomycetaceae bacterium]|nr:hypothetical protein [Planctomycetaceae bacterium]